MSCDGQEEKERAWGKHLLLSGITSELHLLSDITSVAAFLTLHPGILLGMAATCRMVPVS